MKIIDKSGKRLDGKAEEKAYKKRAKEEDPIIRTVEKDDELSEYSPMDPPEAYDETYTKATLGYDEMNKGIQVLMDEHKKAIEQIEKFEAALLELKTSGYRMTREINDALSVFFQYFDNNILEHNRKEEKYLFQLLHDKMIESGESSKEAIPQTAVDLMEDDHVKFIQLAGLTFNLLGLAVRLPDENSRALTFDVAFNSGHELIELLKLHIFREDNTLFPIAQQLISTDEFAQFEDKLAG